MYELISGVFVNVNHISTIGLPNAQSESIMYLSNGLSLTILMEDRKVILDILNDV